jgi:hypothetical protein
MKKILLLIAAITLFLILGIVTWAIFFPNPSIPIVGNLSERLPFGSGDSYKPDDFNQFPPSGSPGSEDPLPGIDVGPNTPGAALFRLTAEPVSGFVILSRGDNTIVRYTDRATGHIYDVNPTTMQLVKVTNTTIPRIYEAHFSLDGNNVLYRTLQGTTDQIENSALTLVAPTATSTAGEVFHTFTTTLIRGDIDEVSAGSRDTLYMVVRDNNSIVSVGFDGSSQRNIFTAPFTEWRLNPSGTNLITWTKASAQATGFAYNLNPSSGSLTKLLGPLTGLSVAADPQGGGLAYSYIEGNETVLYAQENSNAYNLQISPGTIAEKCAWGTVSRWVLYCGIPTTVVGKGEPDNWYKGMTQFSDNIWVTDTRVDFQELLADPKRKLGVDLDVYNPRVSPTEDYLIFTNKRDLSLWALKLD